MNYFWTIIVAVVFLVGLVLVLRWLIYIPILTIIRSIKKIRAGKAEEELRGLKNHSFFKPLVSEISKISTSLLKARSAASNEARLRLDKTEAPWTEERLKEFATAYLKNQQIFLVYKTEPYTHKQGKNGIFYTSPAGGVPIALEPLI